MTNSFNDGTETYLPDGGMKRAGLYDRDAVLLAEEPPATTRLAGSYVSVWRPAAGMQGFATLVTAQIGSFGKRPMQLTGMAARHVVLASGQGKGLAVRQLSDGSLQLYCLVPGLFNGQAGCNIDFSSDDAVRQYLKSSFAGWHHVYHEALAVAHGFSLVSMSLADVVG